ncbi:hypothetical protein P3X46_018565 [Hevea brasiliensis]|uniref:Protein kinase domain-containing protein n=1 Tax=Hevea brasiliensis TaxID=3981 RepID=A0ABQ9LR42_HEVBR|nr:hypothetical protein P3X46_018565 [Hevea brasiliensis]
MAIRNLKHSHFQFPGLYFGAFRLITFMSFIHSANTLSFDLHSFNNRDLLFQGDALLTDQVIHLSGQALYRKQMHLWDKATGKLTDFETLFTFSINSDNGHLQRDGLSFFLVPNDSSIPSNSNGGDPIEKTGTQFVAVEFDPRTEHVGIYINSFQPVKGVEWHCTEKENFSAVVNYCAAKKLLSSSRELSQTYTIFSWKFYSSSIEDTLDKKKMKTKWVLGSAIGACAVCAACVSTIGFILLRLKPQRTTESRESQSQSQNDDAIVDFSIETELERGSGPKRFNYSELEQATNRFDEHGKLGQGGFGSVYSGFLTDFNQIVAVKRFSKGSKQGRKEYKSEVKIISSLRHKNLVQLIGWCHERGELLLAYEFMPNGSLDSHLFRGKSVLLWGVRYKIALGLASALLYLHEEWEQCVVHRDIKSSNVMLDTNFKAKLGDFGLARLIDHELGPKTTGPAGTMGYIAPEYISTGKASKESDMYSFGIVALEIACGRRAIEPDIDESQVRLVAWVWELYGNGNLLDAVDQKLCGAIDVKQMERLLIVGLWCAHPDHNLRPSIRQAAQVLNFEAGVPDLPMKMPVAMYQVPDYASTSSSTKALMTFTSFNVGR